MKKIIIITISILLMQSYAYSTIPPYYSAGEISGDMVSVKDKVVTSLKEKGFIISGGYNVANKSTLYVITFTSRDLQKTCVSVKDRGIMASTLKVGLYQSGDKVEVSAINPKYLFLGYLRDGYTKNKASLDAISNKVYEVIKSFNGTMTPFGGSLKEEKLKKYHYMMGMPYFDEPVLLKEFTSFTEATETIKSNLTNKKGDTKLVYKIEYTKAEMAVYGVALLDKEEGEPHFLPIIGTKHLAAMPYEIVVIKNKATMLHGRFRFALHWPDLTMGTFTKIMSTPGEVEDALKALTQ